MDEARTSCCRLIEAHPGMSQRKLAQRMGVSLGKVNYRINAPIAKGLESRRQTSARATTNSPYAYLLTPRGVRAAGDHYGALPPAPGWASTRSLRRARESPRLVPRGRDRQGATWGR